MLLVMLIHKPVMNYCDNPEAFSDAGSVTWKLSGLLSTHLIFLNGYFSDRLYGLVVRVLGYRSGGPGSVSGTTKKSSGSGTGSTQPREYN
jgi:hypothetical protein